MKKLLLSFVIAIFLIGCENAADKKGAEEELIDTTFIENVEKKADEVNKKAKELNDELDELIEEL